MFISPRPSSHCPALCGVSPLTEVDKNPLGRNFVSLVSLYGDRSPAPAPPRAVSEARAPSVAARRSLPYLEVSPTKTERRRGEEAREGDGGGAKGGGGGGAFPSTWKPGVCSMAS